MRRLLAGVSAVLHGHGCDIAFQRCDAPRADPLADPVRRPACRGNHRRHRDHGRRIPRARTQQQRARTRKHRAAAHPPLRPAVRGHRDHRQRPDLRMQFSEIASPETFRIRMSSPDAHLMLKSKVSVLSYIGDVRHLRFRRRADQFVGNLAAAGHQHRRPQLFQDLQVGPGLEGCDPVEAGRRPSDRHRDHGASPIG